MPKFNQKQAATVLSCQFRKKSIVNNQNKIYKMKNLTNSILEFWFSDEIKSKWFSGSADFDEEIKLKFLDDYNFVKNQSIDELTKDKKVGQILARIIILDQFSRNMFRGSPQAFATDNKALSLTKFILNNNMDKDITNNEMRFIYMPLMHSENLADQELCIDLFKKLGDKQSEDYAIRHKVIIEEFGRFPHRNKILQRKSTAAELEFLKQPNSSF